MSEAAKWIDIVRPVLGKFEVAGALGLRTVWNAKGSAAVGKLIREMATKLDRAVEMGRAAPPDCEPVDPDYEIENGGP
ncbi:hypothetical protein PUV54_16600 [Hyphococcus flavus]|uniref:Uncharacterized protein n=1 Tax=Hyphococcus flavus TaxID=1866326 RepID=A0AAF0CFY0_9PROT|nr:hypothetical protein [Hyphococcus flavus]WDI31573.1 hypothetical protein PUV54_16600 [Hyphococcus flavus]